MGQGWFTVLPLKTYEKAQSTFHAASRVCARLCLCLEKCRSLGYNEQLTHSLTGKLSKARSAGQRASCGYTPLNCFTC